MESSILALFIMAASSVLELVLVWRLSAISKGMRRTVSIIVDSVSKIGAVLLISSSFSVWTVLIGLIAVFRTVHIARLFAGRMDDRELRPRAYRTSLVLGVATLLALAGIYFELSAPENWLAIVVVSQAVVAALLGASVFMTRRFYRYKPTIAPSKKALPTVSVCIPARNETTDLAACIDTVLASSYPKLEVLVLDDCSHDKTPQIIRSYAHAGVRFIKGNEPTEGWLAKNAAYNRLSEEASGDVLLFIGVDVRLERTTITELVAQMGDLDMLSALPKRSLDSEASFLIQPIRYWWELGMWRFAVSHPPVLSTCWLIRASELNKLGGFNGFKKTVQPEAAMARLCAKKHAYAFLVANQHVGLTSNKPAKEQYRTALRMRYPQLRRRPESVLALMLLEAIFVLGPFFTLLIALLEAEITLSIFAVVAALLISAANAEVYKLALRRRWILGFFTLPVLIVSDWILLSKSMYAYEFDEVIWKERNICIPLMTVDSKLPEF